MSKDNILEVAFTMAQRDGFGTLTRDGVAAEAGVAILNSGMGADRFNGF